VIFFIVLPSYAAILTGQVQTPRRSSMGSPSTSNRASATGSPASSRICTWSPTAGASNFGLAHLDAPARADQVRKVAANGFVGFAAAHAHRPDAVPVGVFPKAIEDRLLLALERLGERHFA
jgi:hypothetical protein